MTGASRRSIVASSLAFVSDDPSEMQLASSGRVQAFAVAGPERLPTVRSALTRAELGCPNVGTLSWIGIVAPAVTPKPIVDRISR